MNLISLLIFLAIGTVAGWLAGLLMKDNDFGLLGDILNGLMGRSSAATCPGCWASAGAAWPGRSLPRPSAPRCCCSVSGGSGGPDGSGPWPILAGCSRCG